jgi:hypothetical protein
VPCRSPATAVSPIQGILDANTSGVLLLTVNTVDDSSGAGRRRCTNGSAVLRFTDPTGESIGTFGPMEGEFVLSAGEIEVNTSLTTTGRLDISADTLDVNASLTMGSEGYSLAMTGGTIDVAAGDTFRHY